MKNFPLRVLWKGPYHSAVRYAHQAAAVYRGEGASALFYGRYGAAVLAWTVLRAYASAALGLPRMVRKRRAQARHRTAPVREVLGWFDRFGIDARELARSR